MCINVGGDRCGDLLVCFLPVPLFLGVALPVSVRPGFHPVRSYCPFPVPLWPSPVVSGAHQEALRPVLPWRLCEAGRSLTMGTLPEDKEMNETFWLF